MSLLVVPVCVAIAFSAALSLAQSLPSCYSQCLESYVAIGCVATDLTCHCLDSAWVKDVAACVYADCSVSDRQTAFQLGREECEKVGVTFTSTTSPPAATVVTVTEPSLPSITQQVSGPSTVTVTETSSPSISQQVPGPSTVTEPPPTITEIISDPNLPATVVLSSSPSHTSSTSFSNTNSSSKKRVGIASGIGISAGITLLTILAF